MPFYKYLCNISFMPKEVKTTKKPAVKKVAAKTPAVKKPKVEKTDEFAVILTGGKQYKVAVGEFHRFEKITGEFEVGNTITFDKVLLVDDGSNTTIGMPYIKDASVTGELVEIGRSKKVVVIKYKSKVREFKKKGHRQPFFKIKITSIK